MGDVDAILSKIDLFASNIDFFSSDLFGSMFHSIDFLKAKIDVLLIWILFLIVTLLL